MGFKKVAVYTILLLTIIGAFSYVFINFGSRLMSRGDSSELVAESSQEPIVGSEDGVSDNDESVVDENAVDSYEEPVVMTSSRYLSYTPELLASLSNTKRVYFFYAPWCPTCRPADAEFTLQQENIPGDVTLFRTDYDHETKLKIMYGVTYQHTFVYVDDQGKAIATWNGGGMKELLEHTKP